MYFSVSLLPKDIIIEAESEEELKEKFKKIPIEHIVFSWGRLNKEDYKKELQTRHIYLK